MTAPVDLEELKRLLAAADESDLDLLRCDNALRNAAPALIEELEALREYYDANKAPDPMSLEESDRYCVARSRVEAIRGRI